MPATEYETVENTPPSEPETAESMALSEDEIVGSMPPLEDETAGSMVPSEDEIVGSMPPSEDETAGSMPPSEDKTAGSMASSEDETAGSMAPSEEETAGSMAPSEDETAGSMAPSEDDAARSMVPSEDETAGIMSPSEDQTDGSMAPSEDDAARSMVPSEDETAGIMSPSEDQTDGSMAPSEDETAGNMAPSEDETAGNLPPSEDGAARIMAPSEGDTAGSMLPSEDETAGSMLPSEDETAGSMLPSVGETAESTPPSEDAEDENHDREHAYQCPVCRKTDNPSCDHVRELMQGVQNVDAHCPIKEHAEESEIIAYCTHPDCEQPICKICSMISHKFHQKCRVGIGEFANDKRTKLAELKQKLVSQQEKFSRAAKSACDEGAAFGKHVLSKETEMAEKIELNQEILVQEAINRVVSLIREENQNISRDLKTQSDKMRKEEAFFEGVIRLADKALTDDNLNPNQVVRVWEFLERLCEDLGGESEQESTDTYTVSPRKIVKKRLILPRLDSVMDPRLQNLNNLKVGIEEAVLRKCFSLKADDELLQFQGILPLTETEALVLCKKRACVTSVVLYSKPAVSASLSKHRPRPRINLKENGQYSLAAGPGNSLLATLYQAAGREGRGGRREGKNQVLVWKRMFVCSLEQHAANPPGGRGTAEAEEGLKVLTETALPPRDVAVTRDNNLVVLTTEDPPVGDSWSKGRHGGSSDACVLLMTLLGEVLRSITFKYSSCTIGQKELYYPRCVVVNINGDICVTNAGNDRSIVVFNGDLTKHRFTISEPYDDPEMNKRFCPTDICRDDFGRLIVADNHNHSIIRIEVEDRMMAGPLGWRWPAQVILKDGCNGVMDLNYPTKVALGPGHKLWVVCRDNVQVFEYMHTE